MTINIIKAEYIKEYKIRLEFSDGAERVVDFKPFLKQSTNPMTTKYLDKKEFRKFKIEYGDLHWNDYELCFPTIDLYEDNILKSVSYAA